MKGTLTTEGAAEYLGITIGALSQACYRRRVSYYKVGKERRFKKEDLDSFVESCRREAIQ